MKAPFAPAKVRAFTIVELLVVLAIIAIFVAMLMPMRNVPDKTLGTACMYNQKQIAVGFYIWNSENGNRFPWEVSTTNNGVREFVESGGTAKIFQSLSNCAVSARLFHCPLDPNREITTNFNELNNQYISYFVALESPPNVWTHILMGDRHLAADGKPVGPGLFVYTTNQVISWTRELHNSGKGKPSGNLAFYDGHVERATGTNVEALFMRQDLLTNHLAVP